MSKEIQIVNNEEEGRFEAEVDGELAVVEYDRDDEEIIFTHTEVPEHMEGKGIGGKLAKTALDFAKSEGLRVIPACPFIRDYIDRHEEYQSLVVE